MRSRAAHGDGAKTTIDAATIEEWALSYLGHYSSTAANLRAVLRRRVRRRGVDEEDRKAVDQLIDDVVARYRTSGLVDDAAYAAGRARRGVAQGHSLRRIAAGLTAKGVEAADAAAALASLRENDPDPELAAAGAFARRRKLGPFGTVPTDRNRELAAFARAGFSRRVAEALLSCADEASVATLLAARDA